MPRETAFGNRNCPGIADGIAGEIQNTQVLGEPGIRQKANSHWPQPIRGKIEPAEPSKVVGFRQPLEADKSGERSSQLQHFEAFK